MELTKKPGGLAPTSIAAALLIAHGGQAQAVELETEGGWKGTVSTTLSIGASWRAEDPDPKLYSKADGARIPGIPSGSGANNTDGGNLNWGQGERFSTPVKAVIDLAMHKGDLGVFARAKTWSDLALKRGNARVGNADNGYAAGAPLSDASQPSLNKFSGIALLDAYAYNTFDAAGMPLQLRAGKQVVNWGESLFVQGVNQLNPVDLPSLRKPGTEIKEALLPVWSLAGNLGLGGGAALEAFYQLKWDATLVDSCGGYWSPVEFGISTSTGSGCKGIAATVGAGSSPQNIAGGGFVPLARGKNGSDSGQFGLAFHVPVASMDSELGLYGMRINSRLPIISGRTGSKGTAPVGAVTTLNPIAAHQAALGAFGVQSMASFWEYPDGINVFGASLSSNIAGWSVAGELSHTPNQPVQIDGNDLLSGMVAGVGPMAAISVAATAKGGGTYVSGYDRMQKTQLQINTIKILPGMAGASQGLLIAEAAAQWNDVPDSATGKRYGRGFIHGLGSAPTIPAGGSTCANPVAVLVNPQAEGCQNDGYVTRFAWGYRLKAQLDYPGAFATSFTLSPSVFWSHDVAGYSSDTQILKGRTVLALGLKADYQKKFSIDLSYTKFGNNAKFDQFRDRDYYSLSVSSTF